MAVSTRTHALIETADRSRSIIEAETRSGCHLPVVGYDFLSTFYDLAGGAAPLSDEIDGASFRSALARPDQTSLDRRQDALFFHRPRQAFSAIRQGNYKLLLFGNASGKVRGSELYRVEPNPREENFEIGAKEPAMVKKMQKQLVDYLKTVNAETRKGPAANSRRKRSSPRQK